MSGDLTPSTRSGILSAIRALNFRLLRRILHLWIRPRILGIATDKPDATAGQPVCYVLESRSLADLLAVDHACEESGLPLPIEPLATRGIEEARSFFFLAHGEGRWFKRRSHRVHSARLLRLLAAHESDRELAVQLVPVSLFWGHAPARENSIFKLLLSDTWAATNRVKKFLALLFQPAHILVQFGAPVALRELVDGEPDERRRARKLGRILRVHFRMRKQAILGPDLSHRRTLVGSIVTSSAVQRAVTEEAARQGVPRERIEALARDHANEIAAHQSYRVIRFLYVILTWFWNRLYRGFVVSKIDAVQELAAGHELVYVPCHRSHIDYLVLSYLLYINGLPAPHIAAGRNMNIPLLAPFLRGGGAFFMRRSFQDDELYKAVFDEYVHMIFSKGYAVEYFIEGGRSRTGRMLAPRMGLLGLTVRSFRRKPSPPLVFVPVYIGYERVLEVATYVGELRGADKKDESLLDVLNVFRFLKFEFGRVHVNFGRPLPLDPFLDEHLPGWRAPGELDRDALHAACAGLGRELAVRINAAAAVTPVSLLAIILLATSRQRMSEVALRAQIERFRAVLSHLQFSAEMTVTDLPAAEIIAFGERLSLLRRMDPPYADVLYVEEATTVLLTYYRNNVSHLLAAPSLVARILTSQDETDCGSITAACTRLYPYLAAEYFLPWPAIEQAERCRRDLALLESLHLVSMDGDRVRPAPRGSEEYTCLLLLAEIVEPSLQRFFIAGHLLDVARPCALNRAQLEQQCRELGRHIAAVYRFNAPEFFQETLFSTFLTTLLECGELNMEGETLCAGTSLPGLLAIIDPLLDRDIRQGIHEAVTRFAGAALEDTRRNDSNAR